MITLREAPPYQNGWIFGKVPNGLWPPPSSFSENYVADFLKSCTALKTIYVVYFWKALGTRVSKNHANARLYMVISSKNRCHKPSWQGLRPPPPNGQCPNEQRYFFGGASLKLCIGIPLTWQWFLVHFASLCLSFSGHRRESPSSSRGRAASYFCLL